VGAPTHRRTFEEADSKLTFLLFSQRPLSSFRAFFSLFLSPRILLHGMQKLGIQIIPPKSKTLACGDTGTAPPSVCIAPA
jgi:hypothetical protein